MSDMTFNEFWFRLRCWYRLEGFSGPMTFGFWCDEWDDLPTHKLARDRFAAHIKAIHLGAVLYDTEEQQGTDKRMLDWISSHAISCDLCTYVEKHPDARNIREWTVDVIAKPWMLDLAEDLEILT